MEVLMWFRSLPNDAGSPIYVLRFRNELNSFGRYLDQRGYLWPRPRFFRDPARAEVRTLFGFGALISAIRVHGEMGLPDEAIITSTQPMPISAQEFLKGRLSQLKVCFEAHA